MREGEEQKEGEKEMFKGFKGVEVIGLLDEFMQELGYALLAM